MHHLPPAVFDTVRTIEKAVQIFRQTVCATVPSANADHVRAIGEDIVGRARLLSEQSHLRFLDVALFLLDRAAAWVTRDRLPIDQIGGRMPKTLADLGMLKLAEGSGYAPGQPLSAGEVEMVRKARPGTIIH